MKQYNSVSLIERIISPASYFTAGMAGFIWLIIGALIKKRPTEFLMFHIFQSIFLSIAYFLFIELLKMMHTIPFINSIPIFLNMPIGIFYGLSILQIITTVTVLYLIITSFLGMYSYIPYVSDIINSNTGRK